LLTPEQRDRLEVVLVSPRNPLNIGAAARAMANFGFRRLTVVAPFEPHWREARSAVGAPELLQGARQTATIAEAVAGCTFVAGTGTRTHRQPGQAACLLPDAASVLAQQVTSEGRAALVFGPEKHGLTRDDLSYCHALIEIPTDPRQPSMNLGQAVAVCLYELAGPVPASDSSHSDAACSPFEAHSALATSANLDRLGGLIEQTMLAAGYSPRAMQPANRHDLRVLLRRLSPSALDTRRMMGLFRRILYRLEHPPGAGPRRP
jgi:TrmH family RNA methyltransferase